MRCSFGLCCKLPTALDFKLLVSKHGMQLLLHQRCSVFSAFGCRAGGLPTKLCLAYAMRGLGAGIGHDCFMARFGLSYGLLDCHVCGNVGLLHNVYVILLQEYWCPSLDIPRSSGRVSPRAVTIA